MSRWDDLERRVRDLELRDLFPDPDSVQKVTNVMQRIIASEGDYTGFVHVAWVRKTTGSKEDRVRCAQEHLAEMLQYAERRGWR